MVELIVLLFSTIFFVFAVGVPVITWATLRAAAQRKLVERLRDAGAVDVVSRGDEDAERVVSLRLKMFGRTFEVEAVERGEIPLWHLRLDAPAGAPFVLARTGWRAPPELRSLPAVLENDGLVTRFLDTPRLYTVARVERRWFIEVERSRVDAADLVDALRIGLSVVEPGARALDRRAGRPSGAPLALPALPALKP